MTTGRNHGWVFAVSVAASLTMMAMALHRWGAVEIRASMGAVVFLTVIGGVWLLLGVKIFAVLGISLRDDALDRRNVAALTALCGAVMAVGLIYTGGSLGEGPSYLNNVFSFGLGTAGFLALWILLELGARVSVSIAEERDFASGLRMCGFLLAVGLVIGRAVAGNWHSEVATIRDFLRDSWPLVELWVAALVIERLVRPSRRRPFPSWTGCGLVPALLYLAFAAVWLHHLGPWEGMVK